MKQERITWACLWSLDKYHGNFTPEDIDAGVAGKPYESLTRCGNLLVYGGASALFHRLLGGTTVTEFDNTNAKIGVGDSDTAAAASQTDLQAATNKLRKAMDASYPTHSDGTDQSAASATFRSTFGTSEANFTWNEWAIFNASSGGRMLNRKVENLGTKSSGTTWVMTITVTLG